MAKLTYTPKEFAELFGKERTWTYRQLYAGKVKAITKLGQVQIPHSEVEKLLGGVERYRGAASHAGRAAKKRAAKKSPVSKGAKKWTAALKQKRKHGLSQTKKVTPKICRIPASMKFRLLDGQVKMKPLTPLYTNRCPPSPDGTEDGKA